MPTTFRLTWGPGMIGLTIGLALYGVGAGQLIFYMQAFPYDKFQLRVLVLAVFVFDSAQTLALIWFYHRALIQCRLNDVPNCMTYLPPLITFGSGILYWITFTVQSFYAHRVWIISNQNRVITYAVLLSAAAQFVMGLLVIVYAIRTPTLQVLPATKFLPLAAVASAVCDATITASIIYYLRPARTGVTRRGNYIKRLNTVFVRMGVFTFINALAVVVLYCVQEDGMSQFLTPAPGNILSKTYVNSMLSVLNARKPIRDEQQARAQRTVDIPTTPTIR